jgi:hypothetical protein
MDELESYDETEIDREFHRQKCESPPSSSEDLKLKNDADLPESMPPKSVRFKRDY